MCNVTSLCSEINYKKINLIYFLRVIDMGNRTNSLFIASNDRRHYNEIFYLKKRVNLVKFQIIFPITHNHNDTKKVLTY